MAIAEIPEDAPSSSDFSSSSIFGTAGASDESSFKIFLKENVNNFIYLKFHIHEKTKSLAFIRQFFCNISAAFKNQQNQNKKSLPV